MASSAAPFDPATGQKLITPVDPKATPAPIFSSGGQKSAGTSSNGVPYSPTNVPAGSIYGEDGSITAPDGTVIQGPQNSNSGNSTAYPRVTPSAGSQAAPANGTESQAGGLIPADEETQPLTPPIQTPVIPTEDQDYAELLQQNSELIQGVNEKYNEALDTATSNASGVAAAEGLSGSTVAGGMTEAAQVPILAQRSIDLGNIYNQIQQNAQSLQEQQFEQGETSYQDKLAAQSLAYTNATKSIAAMAAAHINWSDYKKTNPDNYNALVQSVGGDPNVADAMFAMSVPTENVLNTTISGSTATVITQDPVTGKVQANAYDLGVTVPPTWTPYKLGTNATRFEGPNYNPNDPSTYIDVTSDPTNGGAITQTVNGQTTVNGVPINNSPSDNSAGAGSTVTTGGAGPIVAALIGIQDPTVPLSQVVNNVNIGVDGITQGIISNEGGSPKGVINNPGNIKFVGQAGATDSGVKASDGGTFASFPTKQDGIQAINGLVIAAANKGMSFNDFINSYTGTTPKSSPAASADFATDASVPDSTTSSQQYIAPNPAGGSPIDTGLTKAAVYQDALQYMSDGKIPSVGLGSTQKPSAIRAAIQNKAAALLQSVGMTLPQYQALYKGDQATVNANIQRLGKIDSVSASLSTQFPRLAQLAGSVGTGITEADIEAGAAAAQEKFGSPDAASYVELIQTVRSDYAALQAGVAGGRGGQFFAENAQSAIPAGLTPAQYLAIQQTIETSAQNSSAAIQSSVSDQFANVPGTGNDGSTGSQITQQQYTTYSSQLKPGEILVQDENGNIGAIPQGEYDPSQYTIVTVGQ